MKDAADITIVQDRSGSMSPLRSDVIGGFNNFVEEQKAAPGECRLTFIQFDTQEPYGVVCDNQPIAEVSPLTTESYQPRGGTPLYDAIGVAMMKTGERLRNMPEKQRPNKVIFVVMTDGDENSSLEYTLARIQEMIKHQESTYGWHFVYLGANQNAWAVGISAGIASANIANYKATPAGTHKSYAHTARNIVALRAGIKSDLAFESDQLEDFAKDE